jgi:reverse gyrase
MLDRLAEFDSPQSPNIDLIVECTQNEKWQIRLSAIRALGSFDTNKSRECLRTFVNLDDEKKYDDEIVFSERAYKVFNVETRTVSSYFLANTKQELDEKVKSYINENSHFQSPWNYEAVKTEEIKIDELVENELRLLYDNIFNRFLKMKLKPRKMSCEKYKALKDKYLGDNKYKFELLCYINKMFDAEAYLGRDNPHMTPTLKIVSAKQFIDRVKEVTESDDSGRDF